MNDGQLLDLLLLLPSLSSPSLQSKEWASNKALDERRSLAVEIDGEREGSHEVETEERMETMVDGDLRGFLQMKRAERRFRVRWSRLGETG